MSFKPEPTMPDASRILVLRGGAIGDFILTWPVFSALRRAWPRAEITLVGHLRTAALAAAAGMADRVLSLDDARCAVFFQPAGDWPPEETAWAGSFDLVLSCLHDPEGGVRRNFWLAGARRVISVPPRPAAGHVSDHYLRVLGELGIPAAAGGAELRLPPALRAAARARLAALGLRGAALAIHPGSGSAAKNWPLASYRILAQRIERAGWGRVLWLAGEADGKIVRALTAAGARALAGGGQSGAAGWLLKDWPLPELAAVLSCCRGYVGNDSGITHLAAAVGAPTLAIFGPTDPAVWGPRGRRVAIVQAPPVAGLARLPPAMVCRRLTALISASHRQSPRAAPRD